MARGLVGAIVLSTGLAVAFQPAHKPFPTAKIDPKATEEAKVAAAADPGLDVTVYVTEAPFEKVCAYYKGIGHEFQMAGKRVRKLPTGQEMRDAFFILDGSKDLTLSKLWVKVQRPYIGYSGLNARSAQEANIRDVTAIVVSKRK